MAKILKVAFLSERYIWQRMFDDFVERQKIELFGLGVELEITKMCSCSAYNNVRLRNVKQRGGIDFHIFFFEAVANNASALYFVDIIKDLKTNFPDVYLVGVTGSSDNSRLCRESGVDEVVQSFLENRGADNILLKFIEKM